MRAVAPPDTRLVDEAQIRLVHEGGRVQRVVGTLAAELGVGDPAELVVDQGDQPVQRLHITGVQLGEEGGHCGLVRLIVVGVGHRRLTIIWGSRI